MFRLISLRLMESYFRHRWLYLLPVVVMVALAVASFYTAKPKYSSSRRAFLCRKSPYWRS